MTLIALVILLPLAALLGMAFQRMLDRVPMQRQARLIERLRDQRDAAATRAMNATRERDAARDYWHGETREALHLWLVQRRRTRRVMRFGKAYRQVACEAEMARGRLSPEAVASVN